MSVATRVFLLLLMMVLGSASAFAADKVTTVPVHFAKGTSSAALKGSFSGYDSVHYTIEASAGQKMTVKITGSSNANFNVLPAGAEPGQASAIGKGYVGEDWSGTLPVNGTYTVQVFQMRASARRNEKVAFTIHIGITGAGSHQDDATAAPAAATAGKEDASKSSSQRALSLACV